MRTLASIIAWSVAVAAGCGATEVREVDDRRGQVNGESFELLSESEKRGEWNIRIRGNAMWVAHTEGEDTEELGKLRLEPEEVEEMFELIRELDFPESDASDVDGEDSVILYRHRIPGELTFSATLPRKQALKQKRLRKLVKMIRRIIKDRTGRKARI